MAASMPLNINLIKNNANVEWLFCPSDVFHLQSDFNLQTMFRIHPFPEKEKHVFIISRKKFTGEAIMHNYSKIKKEEITTLNHIESEQNKIQNLVEIDSKSNIFYLHIGNRKYGCENCLIRSPAYKWPQKYTYILWIKWEPNLHILTTFDSTANVPIIVIRSRFADREYLLGCVSERGWKTLHNYKLNINEWQFIVAIGGKMNNKSDPNGRTRFFVGSLANEPTFVGSVGTDICGFDTYRIGHYIGQQGPGKVAYIKIYNIQLSPEQILEQYFQSKNSITIEWSKEEFTNVFKILQKYCEHIDGIVKILIKYCCAN